jgi:signal transduction histidine kinase
MVTTFFEDNGQGVSSEEDLQRIFLPFEKSTAKASHEEGFGIGLALVSKVVANMQGEVWAEPADQFTKQGLKIGIRLPKADKT